MHYIHVFYMLFLLSSALKGMEHYSSEELIMARYRWLGKEHFIEKLKYEASTTALHNKCTYINGKEYIGTIDANNQTITTYIKLASEQKSIVLDYDAFKTFIDDKKLLRDTVINLSD